MKEEELVWLSVKVTPAFKEKIEEFAKSVDPLGKGNKSDIVRKACQNYLAGNSAGNENLAFLYNLMENKFRLKTNLTEFEKKKLQMIEGDLSG